MVFGISGTKRTVRNGEVSVRRGETVLNRSTLLKWNFFSQCCVIFNRFKSYSHNACPFIYFNPEKVRSLPV